jgi:hypothetical protein
VLVQQPGGLTDVRIEEAERRGQRQHHRGDGVIERFSQGREVRVTLRIGRDGYDLEPAIAAVAGFVPWAESGTSTLRRPISAVLEVPLTSECRARPAPRPQVRGSRRPCR